jgi:hypothetical protein
MFFKRFWQIFSFKNCFTPRFSRETQSGQLHFTAGSCVSERAGCEKPARSERLSANQIASFSLIKNNYNYARAPNRGTIFH